MAQQNRSKLAYYINTTPESTGDTYVLIGYGVTEAKMNYNPQTTTEQYIHEDVATTTVDAYQIELPITGKLYVGDTAFEFFESIRQGLAAGAAGTGIPNIGGLDITELVEVRKYEDPDTAGTSYPATKFSGQISIADFGGSGGGKIEFSGTFHVQGTPVDGDFNVSTKAFTATP